MSSTRRGNYNAFWAGTTTGANGTSAEVEIGTGVTHLAINITVAGATTVKVQCAPLVDQTSDGTLPDADTDVWHDFYYGTTQITTTFAGAGSRTFVIPDWVVGSVRLHSTADVVITAGWEAVYAD